MIVKPKHVYRLHVTAGLGLGLRMGLGMGLGARPARTVCPAPSPRAADIRSAVPVA